MRALVVLVALFLSGCALGRAYMGSFDSEGARELLAPPKTNMAGDGVRVQVLVYNDGWTGRCFVGASNSITCDFGIEWLMNQAQLTGGWYMLNIFDAEKLCGSAMFSAQVVLRPGVILFGTQDHIRQCAYGLTELRYRELAPPANPENQ